MPSDPRATPAMQQYARFKAKNPDALLLFRMGDFYELFDADAVTISKALGLTLTQRSEGVPMAGMPFHQLDTYLRRLITQGFRVAVVDQVEDPTSKAAKDRGIVARAITRVITPGTLVDETLLEHDATTRLAAILFTDTADLPTASAAILDVSTGEFTLTDGPIDFIRDELARRGVRELLYPATADGKHPPRITTLATALNLSPTPRPTWNFRPAEATDILLKHYKVSTLAGFGLAPNDPALGPAAAVIDYVHQTQTATTDEGLKNAPKLKLPSLNHIQPPKRLEISGTCIIDAATLRSLEIERTLRPGTLAANNGIDGSLISVFLSAGGGCTPMGRRTLREWLVRPLASLDAIRVRHDAVATLTEQRRLMDELGDVLPQIQDLARIGARISVGRATPRDIVAMSSSVTHAATVSRHIEGAPTFKPLLDRLTAALTPLLPLVQEIARLCVESPPPHLREGGLIRDGVDPELDEARLLQKDAGAFLAEYQARLIAQYDLPNLKVAYNKIFGYYIELPAAQARTAPPELRRTQTLKNAERYTTPELRDFENKVTTAEARALERERLLFDSLCERSLPLVSHAAALSDALAELDVLVAFASTAVKLDWKRPELVDVPTLDIEQGRHAVLDLTLGSRCVPNDCGVGLSPLHSLSLITGPNMAGKSTYIRMVALTVLLAHAGSFVPADRAVIGLTDRIFTRVGADDALHSGQSTFMVEMTETANILNHATARSLVILDEIGRGTSTLDGLSLAWAVAEYLASRGTRTLFATHYHELTDLEARTDDNLAGRVKNLHVAVREWGEGDTAQIVFVHRILPGKTDQSYGIHVAKLAGIPDDVITRARAILASLSVTHAMTSEPGQTAVPVQARGSSKRADTTRIAPRTSDQLALFTEFVPHPALDALREIKLDALTPLQAFDALRQLHLQATSKE
ncbi:MAG: DNA mismatch repair protein MutS [Planctomycetes bacterium]|nr:DNA mismatch repair protein MutS [Planctomycetota bacterium]